MSETIPAPSAVAPPAAATPAAAPLGKVAYRRLPGRVPVLRLGLFFVPGGRLYFGPDHLLKIETGATNETYKRFAFREITAVNLVQTERRRTLMVIAGVCILIIGFIALIASMEGSGTRVMSRSPSVGSRSVIEPWLWAAGFAVPFILLIITNIVRGPTCRVTLHTALGPEPLPTLSRLRVAVPVVREIATAVEQAQGKLDAIAMAARISTSLPPG